jgi:hypothetical protein
MTVLHCGWSLAKSYFKGTAEMRRIFKAAFKCCFTDRFIMGIMPEGWTAIKQMQKGW